VYAGDLQGFLGDLPGSFIKAIDLVTDLVIYYVVTSSATLRIITNPLATLESTSATSELTSSSTLVGLSVGLLPSELACCPTGQAIYQTVYSYVCRA